jgi:hypothetical protein
MVTAALPVMTAASKRFTLSQILNKCAELQDSSDIMDPIQKSTDVLIVSSPLTLNFVYYHEIFLETGVFSSFKCKKVEFSIFFLCPLERTSIDDWIKEEAVSGLYVLLTSDIVSERDCYCKL